MYSQSTAVRSRGGAARRGSRSRGGGQERVRAAQLAVCLVLFLTAYIGKGIFPGRLMQVREEVLFLISEDFDFQGALAGLGESLAGSGTVLEDLGAGGIFGKTLAFAGSTGDSLEVICRRPCDVVFIKYDHLFSPCGNACLRHSVMMQNLVRLMTDKAQALSRRVDVLSRRSIREKLLCYFRQLSQQAGNRTFTLPFSLSTLADYIATDRSAMMRELKRLREEGSVRSDGRQFTLRQ